jgi:hypothetical protein
MERLQVLQRALRATCAAHGGRMPGPVCFTVQLPTDARVNATSVRRLLEDTRRDLRAASKQQTVLLFLGLKFEVVEAGDVARLMHFASAISCADVLVMDLRDPTALEGLRSDVFDVMGQHQLLVIQMDACISTPPNGVLVDPRAFVLPSKSLPKGRVALFCSYPLWLRGVDSIEGISNVRKRLAVLQHVVVEHLRVPILTGFGLLVDGSMVAEDLLAFRNLRDVYALLSVFCGASTGRVSRNMYADASAIIAKVLRNSCAATAAKLLQSIPVVAPSSPRTIPQDRTTRRKRQRPSNLDSPSGSDDADDNDVLQLIEDVPAAPKGERRDPK